MSSPSVSGQEASVRNGDMDINEEFRNSSCLAAIPSATFGGAVSVKDVHNPRADCANRRKGQGEGERYEVAIQSVLFDVYPDGTSTVFTKHRPG